MGGVVGGILNSGGVGTVTATGGSLTSNSVVLGAGTNDTKVIAGLTTDGSKELDIGAVGVGSGVLGLKGTTSGTATLTAPAVAGTITNPIAVSNSLNLPSGTVVSWNADAGISRNAASTLNFGNGTDGSIAATIRATLYQGSSGFQVTAFGAFTGVSAGTRWVYNNGTIAGTSANLTLDGKMTNYNSIATVDNGIPSEVAAAARDQTGLTAALAATTLYTPVATGRFRVSVYAKVTTAATNSSVLGGTTGFTLTFTDGTDSVAQSIVLDMRTATGTTAISAAGNSTTTVLNGDAFIYAKTGVAIQLAVDYTSVGATPMAYCVRASVEAM